MKYNSLLNIAINLAAVSAVSIPSQVTKRDGPAANPYRRGEVICENGIGGRVELPAGIKAASNKQIIEDPSLPSGAKRIKMRYGPYEVPGMMKKNFMGSSGALWNCADDKIEKPCEECMLYRLQAGLEYPNGTNANIDSGQWLHHMVAFAVGPGRWDPTCFEANPSLPHFAIATDSKHSERFFASGNERTAADLTRHIKEGKEKVGYFIKKTDEHRFIVDLMNMNMKDELVYLTMTYDLYDGPYPDGWKDLQPVWLDADQCGMSDVKPNKTDIEFTIKSKPWTPNVEGKIVGIGTHLHDGGVALRVEVNDATSACNSIAKYGETNEYVFRAPAGGMEAADVKIAEKHISSMSTCYFDDLGVKEMKKDQSWLLSGDYNYKKYEGNWEEGEPQDIMAISIIYVEADKDRKPPFEQ